MEPEGEPRAGDVPEKREWSKPRIRKMTYDGGYSVEAVGSGEPTQGHVQETFQCSEPTS